MNALLATHGRPEMLTETLSSLASRSEKAGFTKIIVVENGGKNGVEEICNAIHSKAEIIYLYSEEGNKSLALNHGLKHCDDALIFMTDDDVVINERAISCYQEVEKQNLTNAYFGGPTEAIFESDVPSYIKNLLPASAKGWSSTQEEVESVGLFIGFNWAAWKSDLIEAGGFNPNFGPGSKTGATGQESNMQKRLLKLGKKPTYLHEARIPHQVPSERSSPEWLLKRSFRQGVENGLNEALKSPNKSPTDARIIRYKYLIKRVLLKVYNNKSMLFRNQYYINRYKGIIHGYKVVQNKQYSTPPFFTPNSMLI